MTFKHLVTSGCSFSTPGKWPTTLASRLNKTLYNLGQNSAGNDWISRTAIYQTSELLTAGVDPAEILVVVMWSGMDRKGLFVSRKENRKYDNFAGYVVNFLNTHNHSGYILGSLHAFVSSEYVLNYKNNWLSCISLEELAVESYEHFLRLQWFCKSYNIKLLNLTYGDILHYPNSEFLDPKKTGPLTKDIYKSVEYMYNMIDFNQWAFYDETAGQFEYALNNKLSFDADRHHPSLTANEHYVDNFLVPTLKEKALI